MAPMTSPTNSQEHTMQTVDFAAQATHHVSLVLDNDEGLYNWRREIVEQNGPEIAPVAAALKDWAEELVGVGGEEYGLPELTMLNREMVGLALAWVNWDKLAADYIAEENE